MKSKLELIKKDDTIKRLQERLHQLQRKKLPKISSFFTRTVIATHHKNHLNVTTSKDFVIRQLEGIPKISQDNFEALDCTIGAGVFGSVKLAKIHTLKTIVVVKVLDEKTSQKSLLAEVVALLTLSGNEHFPFCYGLLDQQKCIVMEFLGKTDGDTYSPYPTLAKLNTLRKIDVSSMKYIFTEVLKAVQFLHSKGILHNDIKSDNVVVCDDRVVLIDLGKATMMKCPVIYNLNKSGQVSYNLNHRHLAFELRNLQNAKQTQMTDIYSIGYMFKHTAALLKYEPLIDLGRHMKTQEPSDRLSIEGALNVLNV